MSICSTGQIYAKSQSFPVGLSPSVVQTARFTKTRREPDGLLCDFKKLSKANAFGMQVQKRRH